MCKLRPGGKPSRVWECHGPHDITVEEKPWETEKSAPGAGEVIVKAVPRPILGGRLGSGRVWLSTTEMLCAASRVLTAVGRLTGNSVCFAVGF